MIQGPLNDVLWKALNGHGLFNTVELTPEQIEKLFGDETDENATLFRGEPDVKK